MNGHFVSFQHNGMVKMSMAVPQSGMAQKLSRQNGDFNASKCLLCIKQQQFTGGRKNAFFNFGELQKGFPYKLGH